MSKSRYIARIVDSVIAEPSISRALNSHDVDKFTKLLVEDKKFNHILQTPEASRFVDAISKDKRVISLLRVPSDSILGKIMFHPNFKDASSPISDVNEKLSGAIDGLSKMSNNVSSLKRDMSSISRKLEASGKNNAATITELSKYLRSSGSAIDLGLNGILKKLDSIPSTSATIDENAIPKIMNHPGVLKFMDDLGKIGSALSGKIDELSQKMDGILKSLSSSNQSQKSQEKEVEEAIKSIPEDDKKKKEHAAHRAKMVSAGRKLIAGYGISALAYLVPSATAFGVGLFSVLSFGGGVLVLWGAISLVRNYVKKGW